MSNVLITSIQGRIIEMCSKADDCFELVIRFNGKTTVLNDGSGEVDQWWRDHYQLVRRDLIRSGWMNTANDRWFRLPQKP